MAFKACGHAWAGAETLWPPHPSQADDAPQAHALMRGRIAELAIADAAYDAGRIRTVIATKQAEAVIPSNPSRTRKPPACLGS